VTDPTISAGEALMLLGQTAPDSFQYGISDKLQGATTTATPTMHKQSRLSRGECWLNSGELRRDDWPVGVPHFEPSKAEGRLKEPAFTFIDEAYQYLAIDGPPQR